MKRPTRTITLRIDTSLEEVLSRDAKEKGLSEEEFRDAVEKIGTEFRSRGVKPTEMLCNLGQGRSFCITEASSLEAIREAHIRAGLPVDEVLLVDKMS